MIETKCYLVGSILKENIKGEKREGKPFFFCYVNIFFLLQSSQGGTGEAG